MLTNLNCRVESLLKELEDFPEYMDIHKYIIAERLIEKKWAAILKQAESL